MSFSKNGYICRLEKDKSESFEHYITRGLFVASQKPNSDKEYDEAVLYSKIYINTNFHKCGYPDKIMKKLDEMIKNLYSEE